MIAKELNLKAGDKIRRISTHYYGFDYCEKVIWEVIKIDDINGPFIRIVNGQGITPHSHFMSWNQRVVMADKIPEGMPVI